MLFPGGAFDEFDFWTGTFALVVFALGESIIFAWIFGMDRAWDAITRGADMKVPKLFRFVLRYVTPTFLLLVFLGSLLNPEGGDWRTAFASLLSGNGWQLAPDSVAGKIFHVGSDYSWFDAAGNPTKDLVMDGTRLLLMFVFLGCAFLVYKAWKKKRVSA